MAKQATIRDVADAAKVSIATVSRVLNKSSGVRPELAARVLRAADAMNYSPNAVARSLKKAHTASIAYLVSNISDPFFIAIARGVESYIRNYGYNLMVCSIGHSKETEREYIQHLQGKKVDGMIINTTGYNDDLIANMSHQIPVVLSNRRIDALDFIGDFVDNENVGCTYELTKRLLMQGHKRIAIIYGPEHLSTAYERYRGFCSAMKEFDQIVDSSYPYQYSSTFTRQTGFDGTNMMLSLPKPPTAFVFASSELAFGGMRCFLQRRIQVPDEVSFVCVGDLPNREFLYIKPTLSSVNLQGMGERMAELLLERINSDVTIQNREIRFSSTILEGNSIKTVRISSKATV